MRTKSRSHWARYLAALLALACLTLLGGTAAHSQQPAPQPGTPRAYGDIPLDAETYKAHLKTFSPEEVAAVPVAYDARSDGIVTPAKDQGACGACWAFASAGAMESHILKAYGGNPATLDLSEQQLVSCDTANTGCCGGNSTAPQYWRTTGPIQDTCFPYAEGGTICPVQSTVLCSVAGGCQQQPYYVKNWHTVTPSMFKTSLYYDGPSYWRYDVYDDFQTFWNTGAPGQVYVNGSGSSPLGGHAVLLIGWDDTKSAYLCKNSWGATGGPNGDGTFWIKYSGHAHDLNFQMSNFNAVNCYWQEEFFDDFESGYANWSMTGLWHGEKQTDTCGSQAAPFPSPTHGVYFGTASCWTDQYQGEVQMLSDVDLSGALQAGVDFWTFNALGNYAYMAVHVSTDGGANWATLTEVPKLAEWYNRSFTLEPYIGGTLRARVFVDTDDWTFGSLVDDFRIRGCYAPPSPLHIYRHQLTWANGPAPGIYNVTDYIVVHDSTHTLARNVTVYGTWTLPNSAVLRKTAITNTEGRAVFTLQRNQGGYYKFCVTNMAKLGYYYAPASNEAQACKTIMVGPK
jgi:C1A family cysteine protease